MVLIGIPLVVLALALWAIARRERRLREAGLGESSRWQPITSVLTVVLVLFMAYMVVATLINASNPPGSNPY